MDLIYGSFYKNYIEKVKHFSIYEALTNSTSEFENLLSGFSEENFDFTYAQGKWTLAELAQHMIDTDAVFFMRALWMVRGSSRNFSGFEQDDWVEASKSTLLSLGKMRESFLSQRNLITNFFDSLTEHELGKKGMVSGFGTNVRAIGYITAGHTLHHTKIIKERYLPLLNS